jgi:tRNA G10  N-methylase Trm11
MKYIFILGNNPGLSVAEIKTILPQAKVLAQVDGFLVIENEKIDCAILLNRLGGTIKIGVVLGTKPDFGPILGAGSTATGKFKFGVSFYGTKKTNFGMQAKGLLKEKGISARLVESREPALSSVIVTKEKCQDFLVLPDYFGLTCAVQNFEEYGHRDFGRPAADALSGMLPPKMAKIMINLSGVTVNEILLDPFCGSGTILSEALALGFRKLIGFDVSAKAVADSKKNLDWIIKELSIKISELKIEQLNVKQLAEKVPGESIDAIVTEPFLGQPLRGNEKPETIKKIIGELSELYVESFWKFKKILKSAGKIVIVIPQWHIGGEIYNLDIETKIEAIGLKRLDNNDLIYKRENQKVWRKIEIWQK